MGSVAARVESVRLDLELKRDLLLRAARDRISVSEVIRRALGEHLDNQLIARSWHNGTATIGAVRPAAFTVSMSSTNCLAGPFLDMILSGTHRVHARVANSRRSRRWQTLEAQQTQGIQL